MGGSVHLLLVIAIASGLMNLVHKPRVLTSVAGLLESVFSKGREISFTAVAAAALLNDLFCRLSSLACRSRKRFALRW